jgi:hypothetical protein
MEAYAGADLAATGLHDAAGLLDASTGKAC